MYSSRKCYIKSWGGFWVATRFADWKRLSIFWDMYEQIIKGLGKSPNDPEPFEDKTNTVLQNAIYVERYLGVEPTVNRGPDPLNVVAALEYEITASE